MSEVLRPNYFQGQFLGAEDFAAEQRFHRDQQRRHVIGHHTWGIMVGLELVEREAEGGVKEVFVQPGMAIDGYGRESIVWRATLVDVAQLVGLGAGDVSVWLVYDEEAAGRSDIYCGDLAVYERMRQVARLIIEPDDPDSHSISVDGDDIKPPSPMNEDDLIAPYDESVPYQEFPVDQPPWYVRLGSITWDGSKIETTSPEKLTAGRRYVGSVAQALLSPDSTLRIADRLASPTPTPDDPEDSYARLCAVLEGYLEVVKRLTTPQIGIGVNEFCKESSVARLHVANGSAVTDAGTEPTDPPYAVIGPTEDGVHLMLDHNGAQVFADDAFAPGTLNLQLKGGNLAINTDKLFVKEDGNVGIGTVDPGNPLHIKGNAPVLAIDGASGQAGPQLSLQVDETQKARLYFNPAATGRLQIDVNGGLALEIDDQQEVIVGKSTIERLEVSGIIRGPASRSNALRIETPTGTTDIGSKNGSFSHFYTSLPKYYFDKEIRVNGMIGSHQDDLVLATNGTERIRVNLGNGNVGIGLPTPPTARLHVRGSIRLGSDGNLFALGAPREYRVVAGSATGGEENESGPGYTVQHTTEGRYLVEFASSFSARPFVVCSSNDDKDHFITAKDISSSGFGVECWDLSMDANQNSPFSFIAVGIP